MSINPIMTAAVSETVMTAALSRAALRGRPATPVLGIADFGLGHVAAVCPQRVDGAVRFGGKQQPHPPRGVPR